MIVALYFLHSVIPSHVVVLARESAGSLRVEPTGALQVYILLREANSKYFNNSHGR